MESSEQDGFEDRLRRQVEAYHEAALAYAAVKLAIPETMGSKEWTATRLAAALDLSAPHLERMLVGLTTLGLAETRDGDSFVLTKAGQGLAPGSPSTLREKLLIVIEQYWQPWAHLSSSVASGQPAFDRVFGMGVGDWRQSNAEHGATFDTYLAQESFANAGPVLDRLDITGAETVADLGGGHGGLLASVLAKHTHLKGVLVDRPQSFVPARTYLKSVGVAGRVTFVLGDICERVPAVADIYLLKGVLQQHDDARAQKILKTCRKTLKPDARLIVIERLMPDRAQDAHATDDPAAVMLDLHMMAITGGKVRTGAEMEVLLSDARLAVTACSHTEDGLTVIEATAA